MHPDAVPMIDPRLAGYDFIGDVHGCGDQLVALLGAMDYRLEDGAYRHPERHVVFVGDLVDRGTTQILALEVARAMQEAESATVVMGNHEFNALAWATRHPDSTDASPRYLRHRSRQNQHQHQAFLDQVGDGSPTHHAWLEWFRTLPMWLDLGAFRAVHACWYGPDLPVLATAYRNNDRIDDAFLLAATTEGTPEHTAVEHVLKGPEVVLPEMVGFKDRGGKLRHEARIRWWVADPVTNRDLADLPQGTKGLDPQETQVLEAWLDEPAEPEILRFGYLDEVPLFFGHYWFEWGHNGPDRLPGPFAAGTDFSAVRGGRLVAYRWDQADAGQPLRADCLFAAPK